MKVTVEGHSEGATVYVQATETCGLDLLNANIRKLLNARRWMRREHKLHADRARAKQPKELKVVS